MKLIIIIAINLNVLVFGFRHQLMQKNLIDLTKIPDEQPIVMDDGQFFKNKTILFNDGTVGKFDNPVAKKPPKSKKLKHQQVQYNGPTIKELRHNQPLY